MTDIVTKLRDESLWRDNAVKATMTVAADTIDMLREKLTELEWQGGYDANDRPLCPCCGARKNDGHRENCELKSLI